MESSTPFSSRRLVLKRWGSEEEVRKFAAEGDYELIRDESSDAQQGITRDVLWSLAPNIALQYAVDSRSGCSVFVIVGTPAEEVQAIAASIEQNLHPWTLKDLLAAVDVAKTPQQLREALLRAGIGAPHEFDKKFFKRIMKAMRSGDTTVRSAAVWATSYSRWEEFRGELEKVAEHDAEDSLRHEARIILDHYSRS